MNILIDGKSLSLSKSTEWTSFQEFCKICSDHLSAEGRAIQKVHLDESEVNHAVPPSDSVFSNVKKIEVTTCLLQELIQTALQYQTDSAEKLAGEFLNLSSDCLVDLPQETFNKWSQSLGAIKSHVTFLPQLFSLTHLPKGTAQQISEEDLMVRIKAIETAVEAARTALEAQDIVTFSDTLELKIVPWLKEHGKMTETLLKALTLG